MKRNRILIVLILVVAALLAGCIGSVTTNPPPASQSPNTTTEAVQATGTKTGNEYGADGWAYTTTKSLKMRIPDGWEVGQSQAAKAVTVRSKPVNGNTIIVRIDTYSSMLKGADRTPENQAKQNVKDLKIIQDKWGNADVWYRENGVLKDDVMIAGFAAFDADNCVKFDIRVNKNNSTMDDFLKSDAWKTFKESFEVTRP